MLYTQACWGCRAAVCLHIHVAAYPVPQCGERMDYFGGGAEYRVGKLWGATAPPCPPLPIPLGICHFLNPQCQYCNIECYAMHLMSDLSVHSR